MRAILDFKLPNLASHWQDLVGLLGPERFINAPDDLKPDLGLHLHRLGFDQFEKIHFVLIPIGHIARITDGKWTIGGGYKVGEEDFCASFDFENSLLPALLATFPDSLRSIVKRDLAQFPFQADLRNTLPMVNLECELGDKVETTREKTEEFCPFKVTKISGEKS